MFFLVFFQTEAVTALPSVVRVRVQNLLRNNKFGAKVVDRSLSLTNPFFCYTALTSHYTPHLFFFLYTHHKEGVEGSGKEGVSTTTVNPLSYWAARIWERIKTLWVAEKKSSFSAHINSTHTQQHILRSLFFLTKCQDWILVDHHLFTLWLLWPLSLIWVRRPNQFFFPFFFFLSSLWTEQRFRETLWKIKKKNEEKKEAQPIPSPGLFVLSSDTKTLWKKKRSKANSLNEKMRHAKCERKGGGSNHFSSPPPKSPHRPCVLWDLLRRLAFFFFPLVTHTTGADQVCGT